MTPAASTAPPPPDLDSEALAVALSVAPGVWSRNKLFSLFKDPRLARARARARLVRSVVGELARHPDVQVAEPVEASGHVRFAYAIAELSFSRRVDLSRLEAATVRYLLEKANARIAGLACTDADRALVEHTLCRLGV